MQYNHGFGVIESVGSVRTYTYDNVTKSSTILPTYYILDKKYIIEVLNQGMRNSCVGHGLVAPLYTNELKETGKAINFSPYYIYGKLRSQFFGEGMIISETLQEHTKLGSVPVEQFNYPNLEMPEIREEVLKHPELDSTAETYKIKGYVRVDKGDINDSTESIKRALFDNEIPIIIATDWFGAKHCVCIVGWDDKKQKWYCLNSWGKQQGINGFNWIPYDKIEEAWLVLDAENSKLPFTDINEDDWYYGSIKNMYMIGLMNGTSTDTFEPEKEMTRAEVATLMDRLLKKVQSIIEESNV